MRLFLQENISLSSRLSEFTPTSIQDFDFLKKKIACVIRPYYPLDKSQIDKFLTAEDVNKKDKSYLQRTSELIEKILNDTLNDVNILYKQIYEHKGIFNSSLSDQPNICFIQNND